MRNPFTEKMATKEQTPVSRNASMQVGPWQSKIVAIPDLVVYINNLKLKNGV